jgi:thiol:disulfide interchange protein DsbA
LITGKLIVLDELTDLDMAKKKKDPVRNLRIGIIAAVGVLVAGVAVWGALYSTGVTEDGEIVEGKHYRTIENPPKQRPGQPVVVTEYFSYACIHCKNFDPTINEWALTLPQGSELRRSPVAYSPAWLILSEAYLALEMTGALEENHERIFRAIHDSRRGFSSIDAVADFVDGQGVSREDFLRAVNASSVRRKLAQAETAQRPFGIASIPALVVADTYVINMDVGRLEALKVARQLIDQIQNPGKSATETASDANAEAAPAS